MTYPPMSGAPYSRMRNDVINFLRNTVGVVGTIQAFISDPINPNNNRYIGLDPGWAHWECLSYAPQAYVPHNTSPIPLENRSWQELGALLDACMELGFYLP